MNSPTALRFHVMDDTLCSIHNEDLHLVGSLAADSGSADGVSLVMAARIYFRNPEPNLLLHSRLNWEVMISSSLQLTTSPCNGDVVKS